jgi:gliding motility associated protien GldN
MKKLIFTFSFCSIVFNSFEQGGVGPSNIIIPKDKPSAGVIDGIYEKKDLLAKKRTIPFEHVRENDVTWERRTWSYIDLRERVNYPFYYPNEVLDAKNGEIITGAQGRYSLFYILKTALEKGQLQGYFDRIEIDLLRTPPVWNPILGGDAFTLPAQSNSDVARMIANPVQGQQVDKEYFDPSTGTSKPVFHLKGVKNTTDIKVYNAKNSKDAEVLDQKTETIDPSKAEKDAAGLPATVTYRIDEMIYFQPKDIKKYLLKEDWVFDKERSILDVRIIGLAPVYQADTSKTEKILFWVYFPHARDVLKNYYAYQPETSIGSDFDEMFLMRKFNSVVYKASSLQDRKIEETRFGVESLYESEKVKNDIRVLEHDVWNF